MESIIKKSIVFFSLLSIFSCDVDSSCGSINIDYVTFSTYTLDANAEEQQVGVIFDSIISPQTDSIFFLEDTLSNFELRLSPIQDQTDFYFYYGDFVDTIQFSYSTRSRIDSPECGIDPRFFGLDTINQTFDSLVIVNDTLKRRPNAPITNIKLYIF